jgi:hypothetical protein
LLLAAALGDFSAILALETVHSKNCS